MKTKLEQLIVEANKAYRSGEPIMTDKSYDYVIEKLKREKPDSELLKKGIIDSKPESRKQKLPITMASLNKVKSIEELNKWFKFKGSFSESLIVITPKLDGISLVVNEEIGKCWTRGDGEYGQKSDVHFTFMRTNILQNNLTTFGEAIMSKENFLKHKDKFANPRNMVAGLFNHKSPNESLKDVDYIRYGSLANGNKSSQLEFLNKINNVKINSMLLKANEVSGILLDELYQRWGKEYQIDGLVIEFNDSYIRQQLGREENMNPAYAVAYKNPAWSSEAIMKVTGITWQVSKQGKLKPVIQIEPTEVGGVVISNVTGYNAKYIFDNNISNNATIKVIRSGDVIPKHIETIKFDTFEIEEESDKITYCPCCGEPNKWDETMTELLCTNSDCKEMKIAKLVHFFTTIGVEEFGEPSVIKFYEAGYDSIEKILRLAKLSMTNIEGWGIKSAIKLLSQFKQLKEVGVPLARLLHSLSLGKGIMGEKTYQLILDNSDKEEVYEIVTTLGKEHFYKKLLKINGIAEITAKEFISNVVEYNFDYLHLPVTVSYIQTPKQVPTGSSMSGQKVCFTGFRNKMLEDFIIDNGGEVISGVSKNTTILVTKELDTTSGKAQKATQLGVKVMSNQEFQMEYLK